MDNKKIKFNLSPSAIKVYNKCQLQFYYMYITKESPDSKVYTCYGNGGTVVHKVLEDYVNSLLENKPIDDLIIYSEFDSLWKKYKLDSEVGKNNQPLCREEYQTAVKNGIEFLKNYKPIATEETISFPLENSDIADIGIKGIIDLQAYNDNNEHCIIDWKTSSSVDDDFRIQATHYAYSVYKKHGIIPKVYFIYLKLKKKDSAHVSKYNITLDDINDYEKMLVSLKDEILEKGWDISKYDLGNIYDTFNVHKNKCYKESLLRNNKDNILYNINNNEIEFLNLTDNLRVAIDKKFKYFIKGAIYSDLYTKHIWDGMVHLFKKDKLPLGLLSMLSEYIVDFNKYFNTEYKLVLVNDMRNQLVVEHKYKTQFKDNDILLRDYQNQAIDCAIEKKHGILYMGTGCLVGDTLIELPRNIKKYPNGIKIKNLLNKKNFFVYTFNVEKQCIELKKCKEVWKSGFKDIYEIELMSGKKIQSSLNHKFLVDIKNSHGKIINRKYIELEDIYKEFLFNNEYNKKHKSLIYKRNIYLTTWNRQKNDFIKTDYSIPHQKQYEHIFVMSQINTAWDKDKVVHHIDFNHYNNEINNLKLLTNMEHSCLHTSERGVYGKDIWHNGEHPKGMLGKHHNNKGNNIKVYRGKSYVNSEFKNKVSINSSQAIQEKMEDINYKNRWIEKCRENQKIKYTDKIINIKYIGNKMTYDMETEDNHNFIANGIVVHNSGKTIVSAEIIKRLNVRTLFLINRVELVDQTAEVFEDYFGISVGKMIDGELDIVNQITVASIQTINAILQRKDEDSKRLSTYLYNVNCVIYDECQTVKDEGMYELLSKELVNATYIFGLSGSPFRADEHTLKMNALVGSVIYSKSTKELEDMGYLVPTTVYFVESITPPNTTDYSSAYNSVIVNNPARNEIISNIVNKNRNKKILIITKLIEHGKILQKIIPNSFLITSETPKTERKENFKTFKENNGYVLIGSSQIFSAGIDIPDLDIIINVSAHKSDVQSVQTIGRVKRKTENKVMGYYIDFYDIGAKFFKDSAKQRMEILKQFGNNIQIVKDYNEIII